MFPGYYLHARYVSVALIFSSKSTRYFSQVRRRDKLGRLKPLSLSARVSLLRSHGILQIDRRESAAIERIQVLSSPHILVTDTLPMVSSVQASRATECGCECKGGCVPDSCPCALGQVECEVDREGFPCTCSSKSCNNPHGRRFFNRNKVDMHRWDNQHY